MKQPLSNLRKCIVAAAPQRSTVKNALQKVGSTASITFAKSYARHPALIMLGLRVGIRATVIGVGFLAGTFGLESLLQHDIFSGTASAEACGDGYYYETITGHMGRMYYGDGLDDVHGTGDDILNIRDMTNYPIDFKAEDGIPPATLQYYDAAFDQGDYVRVEMCTHNGGLGAGIFSRTHNGIRLEHLQDLTDKAAVQKNLDVCGGVVLFGALSAFPILKYLEYRDRRA